MQREHHPRSQAAAGPGTRLSAATSGHGTRTHQRFWEGVTNWLEIQALLIGKQTGSSGRWKTATQTS